MDAEQLKEFFAGIGDYIDIKVAAAVELKEAGHKAEIAALKMELDKRAPLEIVSQEVVNLVNVAVTRSVELIDKPKDGEQGIQGLQGEPGQKGEPGDGVDMEVVARLIAAAVDAIPRPRDGAPGANAEPVDYEKVKATCADLIELEVQKRMLDFERRAQDVLMRAVASIPAPKNGEPGRDALSLEDFDFELKDGGRFIVFRMKAGETLVEREHVTQFPVFRDIWKEGTDYRCGDEVTWAGSTWIARKDTNAKPEVDDSWKLRTKRGRDGKDGKDAPSKPVVKL